MNCHLTGLRLLHYPWGVLHPKQLLAVREHLGLSKESLARLLGIGVSSVHRWEKGDTGPSGPVLHFYRAAGAAIARGMRAEDILGDLEGDPGRVLARVLAAGFLEEADAARG